MTFNFKKLFPWFASILILYFILFCCVTSSSLSKKAHPAYSLNPYDYVDGYIVKSIVNDTQVYASLPNDDTLYLVTLSCYDVGIKEFFTVPSREWFYVSDVQTIT